MKTKVGIAVTSYFSAISFPSSTSTLTKTTSALYSEERDETKGLIAEQGAHQEALKFMTTDFPDDVAVETRASRTERDVTGITALDEGGTTVLLLPLPLLSTLPPRRDDEILRLLLLRLLLLLLQLRREEESSSSEEGETSEGSSYRSEGGRKEGRRLRGYDDDDAETMKGGDMESTTKTRRKRVDSRRRRGEGEDMPMREGRGGQQGRAAAAISEQWLGIWHLAWRGQRTTVIKWKMAHTSVPLAPRNGGRGGQFCPAGSALAALWRRGQVSAQQQLLCNPNVR